MNRFSEKNDTELCELSLLGENEAYEELVKRHESSVKNTALSVTKDEYFSNDASQEAFVSAWVKLNTLNDFECFGPWVCSIARNCAKNVMRKYYRCASTELSFNLYEYKTSDDEFENDTQLSALRSIWDKERDEELHEIVASLKETFRSVVDLHYFKGLSIEEIAQKLSLPEGTVKWRLSEARKLLRKEYGLMEDKKGNRSLVQKVMEEVEKLKLWKLKNSKKGFETDYEKTLKKVEKLEDSSEKAHALADVLHMGCWWIPGKDNEEVRARIKENAEKGHNEEVMMNLIAYEMWEHGNLKLSYIFDTIIPYLKKHRFNKSLGFVYYWLGQTYHLSEPEKALIYYEKALSVLEENDVYYALAVISVKSFDYKKENNVSKDFRFALFAHNFKIINGETFFYTSHGCGYKDCISPFYSLACCDHRLPSENINIGETIISTDGKAMLTCISKTEKVITAAGLFQNCYQFKITQKKNLYCYEIFICPKIGIVKFSAQENEAVLKNYSVVGGKGLIPFAKGNFWEYTFKREDGLKGNFRHLFEVIYADEKDVTLGIQDYGDIQGAKEVTWGNIIFEACNRYNRPSTDRLKTYEIRYKLTENPVNLLKKAKKLASTEDEKLYTCLLKKTLDRIFETDIEANPEYTEIGRLITLEAEKPIEKGTGISWVCLYDYRNIIWSNTMAWTPEYGRTLYDWPYEFISLLTGFIWSDEWKEGYVYESPDFDKTTDYAYKIYGLPDTKVIVPAGTFENCRHIHVTTKNAPDSCLNCDHEFYYAEGVGLVLYICNRGAIWELCKMKGKGKGFFPMGNGFVRRYKPQFLLEGYEAFCEYTFSKEGDDLIAFLTSERTQKRENYEENKRKLEEATAGKKKSFQCKAAE